MKLYHLLSLMTILENNNNNRSSQINLDNGRNTLERQNSQQYEKHAKLFWQTTGFNIQFSSIQSLDHLGHWEYMKDDSAETLYQYFLQEALVNSFGMDRDVHSLMLSTQHFLCRPWHRPPPKVPQRTVLDRLLQHATCPNHASLHLFKDRTPWSSRLLAEET